MILRAREGWSEPWIDSEETEWISKGRASVTYNANDGQHFASVVHGCTYEEEPIAVQFKTQDDACEVAELILSKWAK